MSTFTRFLLCSFACIMFLNANAINGFNEFNKLKGFNSGNEFPKSSFMGINDMCDGGFYFNFGLYKPTIMYLTDKDDSEKPDTNLFKAGASFEIGNMIKIVKFKSAAIGVRATWLNVNYTNMKEDGELIFHIIQASFIKIGPYVTIGIADKAAIDIYYQISPQYVVMFHPDQEETADFLGNSNAIGASFRFSIFTAGFDTNFGTCTYLPNEGENLPEPWKARFPYLRIYAGLKF